MSAMNCLFSDELINEILICLPSKPLCRFKCVSKHWSSLIFSPYFIKLYQSRSKISWIIVDSLFQVVNGSNDLGFSPAELRNVSSFSPSSHMIDTDPVLISVSGGLLLFSIPTECEFLEGRDPMFVYNPITHHCLELPTPPNVFHNRSSIGFATEGSESDLGESVVDFVVTELKEKIGYGFLTTLLTFSSKTGKWDEIYAQNLTLNMGLFKPGKAIELDGRLFWVDKMGRGLIVWDKPFRREWCVTCRYLPMPEVCEKPEDAAWREEDRCFGIGKDGVQYLERVNGRDLRLWRLNNYKGRGEWVLLNALSLMDIWIDDTYLASGLPTNVTPVVGFFHPFEQEVAFFLLGGSIFSVNLIQKKVLSIRSGVTTRLNHFVLPFVLPLIPSLFPPNLPPILLASKEIERGKEYFNEKNFNQAIDCYSRSIHHSPTVVAFAKRAAAFLKINNFLQAEIDCTKALNLDKHYMKAYARRAIARNELGKIREAKEDAEFCLNLNPGLLGIQRLYSEITFKISRETRKMELHLT